MTKEEAYQKLFEINKTKNTDISEQIKELAVSSEVPKSVVSFITESSSIDIPPFVENLKSKRFYKTFLNEKCSEIDKAKALSSLITHTLIESEYSGIPIEVLSGKMSMNQVTESLQDYLLSGSTDRLNKTFESISLMMKGE